MKFLYYFYILFLVVFRRIGFIIFLPIALLIRKYLRNVVYNYHLQNDIFLKRLYERKPVQDNCGFHLDGGTHSSMLGFVNYRKIYKIEYYPALFFWLWLDDDSRNDTFDCGYNQTIVKGQRMTWLPKFIIDKLEEANVKAQQSEECIFGNSFDLGDKRSIIPLFDFWSVLLWTLRNTAYNFNYKFHQISNKDLFFQVVIFGRLYGWDYDGYITIDNKQIQFYSWECGKIMKG